MIVLLVAQNKKEEPAIRVLYVLFHKDFEEIYGKY